MKGTFCSSGILLPALAILGVGSAMVCAFNNDGKTDILWRNYSTFDNAAWFMNGTTYVSSGTLPFASDANWRMVGTGDFNNDGQLDILWQYSNGNNVVWFMNGTKLLSTATISNAGDANWEIVATGYFNGASDRYIDLVWRHKVTGDNAIWFMTGTSVASTALLPPVSDANWKIAGTGDFNGDGQTDIVWRHYGTGQNMVWFMNGASQVSTGTIVTQADLNWRLVGTGHFNTDGQVDLLWRHSTTGENGIWLMNGLTAATASLIQSSSDPNWKVGGTGDSALDLDGDGLSDLWERNNFGMTGKGAFDDFDTDSDGDGVADAWDYSPLNAASWANPNWSASDVTAPTINLFAPPNVVVLP